MSKTLTSASKRKIESIIIQKIWKKRKSLGRRVSLRKTEKKVYEEINQIGNLGENYDLRDFERIFSVDMNSLTEKKFRDILKEIFEFRNFTYYIPIDQIEDFPQGIEMGKCKTIHYSEFPRSTGPIIKGIIEKYNKQLPNKNLFLKTVVRTIGFENANRKFEEIIEDTLHILKFFINSDIRYSGYLLRVSNESQLLGGVHWAPPHFPGVYNSNMREGLKILSELFMGKKLTEIEERIKKAVIIVSISRGIRYDGFRLSVLCSALEALLTAKNDPITLKLSERISFLIKVKKMRRLDVYKEVHYLYGLRSSFIHQTEEEEVSVGRHEVLLVHFYIDAVINKFINLLDKGYTHVTSTGNAKSIIDAIEALKFGQIKKI